MKNYPIATLLLLFLTLFSCKKNESNNAPAPIPSYKVFKATPTSTTLLSAYPAVLEGISDIEIRSKVEGYIEKIYVEEGQEVQKGQVLFKLETQMVSQDAAAAKARVDAAQVEVNRLIPLVERNIISAVTLETAKANLATAKSNYQSMVARINYATIKSPSAGVVGSLPLKIGSFVSMQTAQPLTMVSDISSIDAYFSMNEKEQLEIMTQSEGKTFQEKISKIPPVQLLLSNGSTYETMGNILTFSGQANTQTGSFRVKARFPNPNRLLRSGETGVIQIPTHLEQVILIPQTATFELQDKRMALILDENQQVKNVPIEVRAVPGGQYFVVDKGIQPNDQVLVEGVGIVQEGTKIQAVLVDFKQILSQDKK